jgi:hypothetical protein
MCEKSWNRNSRWVQHGPDAPLVAQSGDEMAHRIEPRVAAAQQDWTARIDREIAEEATFRLSGPVARPRHRHAASRRSGHLPYCSASRSFDFDALFDSLDEE